ncbi:tetratricopeptide repeat protein [Syntrophorhabdus aromaticivorans]|uniref:Tetratricopeptide repeat protein n=1 Tax=Syntrophorhabdus aromaticivorans TaxID=328301 RepID=A0A351U1M1_9BACT|nr:tetratricopeptide repeat protein [Syntrophorhabdus aromaticivorans]NLW34679.1 tetratricopeptide repeat protein [Syntrophorhabdus aromaticivorans]HBA53852.1 hypothetical protein [Syntrophorhabdus aromaticivorans]
MDAVTYPKTAVIEFLNQSVIPVRVPFDSEPLATEFNLKWTPMLVVLDWNGKEHSRTVGFLPPEELIPSLLLGIAKIYFDHDRFTDAITNLDKILSDYPTSGAAPEAVFLKGVNGYKGTHNTQALKLAYEKLQADYPSSEWAKRALPYRLL